MSRLKEADKNDVAPALMKKFGYKSVMQIPKLDKSLAELKEALAEAGLKSQGFSELRKMLEEYTTQPEFNDMALKSKTLKDGICS